MRWSQNGVRHTRPPAHPTPGWHWLPGPFSLPSSPPLCPCQPQRSIKPALSQFSLSADRAPRPTSKWQTRPPKVFVSRSVVSDSFVTTWAVAHQAPLSVGFSRQEHWSGLPCPPPGRSWSLVLTTCFPSWGRSRRSWRKYWSG